MSDTTDQFDAADDQPIEVESLSDTSDETYSDEEVAAAHDFIVFLEEFGYDELDEYPADLSTSASGDTSGTTLDGVTMTISAQQYNAAMNRGSMPFPLFKKRETKEEILRFMARLHGANTPDETDITGHPLFDNRSQWYGFMISLSEKVTDGQLNPPGLDLDQHPNRRTHLFYPQRDGDYIFDASGNAVAEERTTRQLRWRYRDATEGLIHYAFLAFSKEAARRIKGERLRFEEEWIRQFLEGNRSFMIGDQIKAIEDITIRRRPITEQRFRALWAKVTHPSYHYQPPQDSPADQA